MLLPPQEEKSKTESIYSYVLNEEEVTSKSLLNAVHEVYENRASYINAMNQSELSDPIGTIVKLANELSVK